MIRRAARGDDDAVRHLYRLHSSRVYTVIRRLAPDDALAEDWAQETWLSALKALPRFRAEAGFGTWIHRIAVNRALSGLRRRKVRDAREMPAGADVPGRPASDLLRVDLERALADLPEGMRRVLVLHDIEGFKHSEIGELLGIATGTSKSQLFRARGRMRERLERGSEGKAVPVGPRAA